MTESSRPIALVTGVGRREGIGAAVVTALVADGWDVAFTYWRAYDDRMPWGRDQDGPTAIAAEAEKHGARVTAIEADLESADTPSALFDQVNESFGAVRALVMAHCESVDSSIMDTTVESFDRHFAVNARAAWLLIREFAARFEGPHGAGRIVALTSDHTAFNLPYGASKGALERIAVAAAHELGERGIVSNAVNPGPVQTGWMDEVEHARIAARTPLRRSARPEDPANLIAFLCSERGGWVNGQVLFSNGGFAS